MSTLFNIINDTNEYLTIKSTPSRTPTNPNSHKRPPPSQTNKQPLKKFRNDKEIIKTILNEEYESDSDESESDSENERKLECNNPLCDHKDYTKDEKKVLKRKSLDLEKIQEIKSIDDLIELGKSFHCKKNTVYYGINLRILCNLVEPLTKLKNMVGMKTVKENMVNQIVFFLQGFNQKEKCSQCLDCIYGLPCSKNMNNDMLHTVITGPPGCGKTELGKILGQVYKAMGILSKGHMHIATRSDLIGKYLGHTAKQTQDFIDKCKGGVMFIDEAYALGNSENRDSFSKECLDTLNQNLSERRDFLCIIAGYADALDQCFFKTNEGLKRRFTYRYNVDGYTPAELMEIFMMKIKLEDWKTEFEFDSSDSNEIKKTKTLMKNKVTDFFKKNKKYFPHFGGDIESFLLNCKVIHGKRVVFLDQEHKKVLTMYDIEEGLKTFVAHRKYKETVDKDSNIQTIYKF